MIASLPNSSVLLARFALDRSRNDLNATLQRLATGRKINSGRDDPAGLISSEHISAELRALEAETRALQRQDSNARIAEGHTSQLSTLLGELNGLVVASANTAGLSDAEVQANQTQIDSIISSIGRVSGDAASSLQGINVPDGGSAEIEGLISGVQTAVSSITSGGTNDLASGNLEAAQAAVKSAIADVATARGQIGSFQKYTVQTRLNSNMVAIENLSESRSRIADADYAVEMSNLTRSQILTTSGIKVLKIAQQQPRSVLALLS